MSRLMAKPTKWHMRPGKSQISLGIRPVWSESSLSAWRNLGSLATHWVHSEDWSDWADAESLLGTQTILLVLSWGGWNGTTHWIIIPRYVWVIKLLSKLSCSDYSVSELWRVRERKVIGVINTAQFLALMKVCMIFVSECHKHKKQLRLCKCHSLNDWYFKHFWIWIVNMFQLWKKQQLFFISYIAGLCLNCIVCIVISSDNDSLWVAKVTAISSNHRF